MKQKFRMVALMTAVGLFCAFFSAAWAEDVVQKININTATAQQLMELKGVGEKLAQRIIEYRTQNGPFAAVEDLTKVNGIGPKILADNASVLTVGDNNPPGKKEKSANLDKPAKSH